MNTDEMPMNQAEQLQYCERMEKLVRECLARKSIDLGPRKVEIEDGFLLKYLYQVSDLVIKIYCSQLQVQAGKIVRPFELFDEKDTERFVEDFCKTVEFYVRHPEIRKTWFFRKLDAILGRS